MRAVWDVLTSKRFMADHDRLSWGGIAQVHANHNELITGDKNHYWIDYLRERYFVRGMAGDTLSLGCGAGRIERIFRKQGFRFASFTGLDVSDACVAQAAELAQQCELSPRTRYAQTDLNDCRLAPAAYDFIFFFHSLHHIENLENMMAQCRAALRPGGIFMCHEYVGPSRFQYGEEQYALADALLRTLPRELRRDLSTKLRGRYKERIARKTVEQMIAIDPSEAVRSAEIPRLVRGSFNVLEEKNQGGTLLFPLFENIAGNFDPKNRYHESLVAMMIGTENLLMAKGVIESDFRFFVAGDPR